VILPASATVAENRETGPSHGGLVRWETQLSMQDFPAMFDEKTGISPISHQYRTHIP
jgi:hypothetical protein